MAHVRLVALQALTYEGRALEPGDVFSASGVAASWLRLFGRARRETDADKPVSAPTPEVPEKSKRKRTYKRRDLRAE